jgi:hypothetical protein
VGVSRSTDAVSGRLAFPVLQAPTAAHATVRCL